MEVKNWRLYHQLRVQGMPRDEALRIANGEAPMPVDPVEVEVVEPKPVKAVAPKPVKQKTK